MAKPTTYRRVLLDTGPLVAVVNAKDSEHGSCAAVLRDIDPPLLTCWPVLTEAAWLLKGEPIAWQKVLGAFAGGLFELAELAEGDVAPIGKLMQRYSNLPLQLAAAALLHLADREQITTVFTLDHRDFSVVRMRNKKKLTLLPTFA